MKYSKVIIKSHSCERWWMMLPQPSQATDKFQKGSLLEVETLRQSGEVPLQDLVVLHHCPSSPDPPLLEWQDSGSPAWSRTLSNSYSKLPTRPGIFSLPWSLKLLGLQISAASKLCQLFPPCFSYLSPSSPAMQVLLLSYPPICSCPHMMLGFLPTEFSHHFTLSPEPSRTPLFLTTNSSAFSYFHKPFLHFLALSKTPFCRETPLPVTFSNGSCTFLFVHHCGSHK